MVASCRRFLCSCIRYILNPLFNGRTEKCWTVLSDGTYSVFLVHTNVLQCTHPEEECCHRVIGKTHMLTLTDYIFVPHEFTQTGNISIYIP